MLKACLGPLRSYIARFFSGEFKEKGNVENMMPIFRQISEIESQSA
jgi:hypothetical protein